MSILTAEKLIDITPEIVQELDNVTASAVFTNHLYLAVIGNIDDSLCGKILRYESTTKSWEDLYSVKFEVQGEGTTAITFFRRNDATEIFASLSSSESQFLHSIDGKTFYAIAEKNESYQQLIAFHDYLYAIPRKIIAEAPILYSSNTAQLGKWQQFVIPNFQDTDNKAISQLSVFNNCLYAGTLNPERGFEIWKQEDSNWKPILTEGARGYTLNSVVSSLLVFKGNLYAAVGTPIHKSNHITAPEVLRIYPDDSWDLIVGKPKFTPSGLKVPLSVIDKGFDELSDCTLQFMVVHQDCLYAGTQSDRGLQFWVTENGEDWEPIRLSNLSDRSSINIITVISTPFGLVTVVQDNGKVAILLASS